MSAFGTKRTSPDQATSCLPVGLATMPLSRTLGEAMQRREFIAALGSAAAWPLAARAQQPERVRRISVLTGIAGNDSEIKDRLTAFSRQLEQLGWTEGRNVRIDIRGGGG